MKLNRKNSKAVLGHMLFIALYLLPLPAAAQVEQARVRIDGMF